MRKWVYTSHRFPASLAAALSLFLFLASPIPARAEGGGVEDRITALQKQVDLLSAELQDLKRAQAEKKAAGGDVKAEPAYAGLAEKVKLGGYGSMRFDTDDLRETKDTFTMRRFVLTTDARLAERLRIYSEIEYERFTLFELERETKRTKTGTSRGLKSVTGFEGTGGTELSVEQMWFQYDLFPGLLGFRMGEMLVPLGRFNINHDDNRWNLPRRSLVDRQAPILPFPAAWPELGLGFVGETPLGSSGKLDYQIYVMNGVTLEAETEIIGQSRDPRRDKLELEAEFFPFRGTADRDSKNAKAVAGRITLSPALGQEIGLSGYFGRYTPDFLDSENNIRSFGLDGLFTYGPFELETEFIYTSFDNLKAVAKSFAKAAVDKELNIPGRVSPTFEAEVEFELAPERLAERRYGFWLEPRYRFWPQFLSNTFLGRAFENPQMIALMRFEKVWFQDALTELEFSGGEIEALSTKNFSQNRLTFGLSFRPVPLVALQLALEHSWQSTGGRLIFPKTEEDRATSFLFGVAFGF